MRLAPRETGTCGRQQWWETPAFSLPIHKVIVRRLRWRAVQRPAVAIARNTTVRRFVVRLWKSCAVSATYRFTVGRETPKVAILTLMMSRDFPVATVAIATVASQLSLSTHHFLLLNDRPDAVVERAVGNDDHQTLWCAGSNRGVASGRNELIRAAMVWGADLFVILDDDIVVPCDYVARVVAAYQDLAGREKVGIVCPPVLNFQRLAERILGTELSDDLRTGTARRVGSWDSWRDSFAAESLTNRDVDLMGIKGWRDHYLAVGVRSIARFAELGPSDDPRRTPGGVVRNWPRARSDIGTDAEAFSIDTVPGGVAIFSRRLIETVGPFDPSFDPFGFEDADFSIRALKQGYRHFCLTAPAVMHDIVGRHAARSGRDRALAAGRARARLVAHHSDDTTLYALIALAECLDFHDGTASDPWADARAYIAAFVLSFERSVGLCDPVGTPNDQRAGAVQLAYDREGVSITVDVDVADGTVSKFDVAWCIDPVSRGIREDFALTAEEVAKLCARLATFGRRVRVDCGLSPLSGRFEWRPGSGFLRRVRSALPRFTR